jgi:hypothetical protein
MFTDVTNSSGMFSKQGKSAADKFNILKKKDELLKGKKLTLEMPDLKKKKTELKSPYKYVIKYFVPKKNSNELPNCTKYFPNYNFLSVKNNRVIDWKKSEKRTLSRIKNSLVKDSNYTKIITNSSNSKEKSMLNNQNMNNANNLSSNLKRKKSKYFTKHNNKFNSLESNKKNSNNKISNKSLKEHYDNNYANNIDENHNLTLNNNNLSFKQKELYSINNYNEKKVKIRLIKTNKSIIELKNQISKKLKIKGPNFNNAITRKMLDDLDNKPLCAPQFSHIQIENKRKIKILFSKVIPRKDDTKIANEVNSIDYDPNKILEKVNAFNRTVSYYFNGSKPVKHNPNKKKYFVDYVSGKSGYISNQDIENIENNNFSHNNNLVSTENNFKHANDMKKKLSQKITKIDEKNNIKNILPSYLDTQSNGKIFNLKSLLLNNFVNSKMYTSDELFKSFQNKSFNSYVKFNIRNFRNKEINNANNISSTSCMNSDENSVENLNTKAFKLDLNKKNKNLSKYIYKNFGYYNYNLDHLFKSKSKNIDCVSLSSVKGNRIFSEFETKEFGNFKLNFNSINKN